MDKADVKRLWKSYAIAALVVAGGSSDNARYYGARRHSKLNSLSDDSASPGQVLAIGQPVQCRASTDRPLYFILNCPHDDTCLVMTIDRKESAQSSTSATIELFVSRKSPRPNAESSLWHRKGIDRSRLIIRPSDPHTGSGFYYIAIQSSTSIDIEVVAEDTIPDLNHDHYSYHAQGALARVRQRLDRLRLDEFAQEQLQLKVKQLLKLKRHRSSCRSQTSRPMTISRIGPISSHPAPVFESDREIGIPTPKPQYQIVNFSHQNALKAKPRRPLTAAHIHQRLIMPPRPSTVRDLYSKASMGTILDVPISRRIQELEGRNIRSSASTWPGQVDRDWQTFNLKIIDRFDFSAYSILSETSIVPNRISK